MNAKHEARICEFSVECLQRGAVFGSCRQVQSIAGTQAQFVLVSEACSCTKMTGGDRQNGEAFGDQLVEHRQCRCTLIEVELPPFAA